jgi:multidrug efflux pump subunit AcrA (membrane-fusion protein)
MGRLERAARDLDAATAQLRAAEAGRMAALGEAEVAERRAAEASAELQALRATLGQRCALLGTVVFMCSKTRLLVCCHCRCWL